MKRFFCICTVLAATCWSTCAEFRVWQDIKGNKYEAEFVHELFDKVTLRDARGKEYRLAVEDLSDHDQKYLRVMVPPELEIKFSKKTDLKPKPWELYNSDNDTTYVIRPKVEIHKLSRRPFTSSLRAELFIVARELDGKNYILLSKTDASFMLGDQNDNTYVMDADPVEVMVFTEYNQARRGWDYVGHLAAISDSRGNIVKIDTDIDWLTADKVENLRELYLRGKASMHSRHFDKETVQKAPVPRPAYYTARQR